MVITPESSSKVSMNLNMMVGQAACQPLCRYTQSTLAASCVCWIVPIVTCDYRVKRTCGCSSLKCTWSVSWLTGGRGASHHHPCQTKCKNRPLPNLHLVFPIRLVSVHCCFFAFFEVFSGDFGFLYSRSIPDLLLFLNYFLSVSQWAPFS